jgi:cytochrome d ubiquinol oxidase subunit II
VTGGGNSETTQGGNRADSVLGSLLAATTLLYVLLDGFDLGSASCLRLLTNPSTKMLGAISPVWDGNEPGWSSPARCCSALSAAYAALLSRFISARVDVVCIDIARGRLRVSIQIARISVVLGPGFAGIVRRDIHPGHDGRRLVEGLPEGWSLYRRDIGWFSPFAVLCGFGLVLGYSLLGVSWLVRKCEGRIRERAYQLLPVLTVGVLAFLATAFVLALTMHLSLMSRWLERPYLLIFPLIGAISSVCLLKSAQLRNDVAPFRFSALIFLAAFGTLACSFWPFMIPFALTVEQAASPPASLNFIFWGTGLFVMPLTLIYTLVVYRLFRGKVADAGYE